MPHTLLLFDVDLTLVNTSGAGMKALQQAGKALYTEQFSKDGVDFAGRLDPLIIEDLLAANGVDANEQNCAALRTAYGRFLRTRLEVPGTARALQGVPELLAALSGAPDVTLGLLTGNFPETGTLKLGASGIDSDQFPVQVWGCDSPHSPPAREHLPAVAFGQFQQIHGRAISPDHVTVIGDTPHDVSCAKAHGCRCLAVATGHTDAAKLQDSGADLVVQDLTQTDAISAWLRGS